MMDRGGMSHYRDGMRDGVRMTLDLIIGDNHARLLPQDEFDELRYRGELPDDLREHLEKARRNADAELTER